MKLFTIAALCLFASSAIAADTAPPAPHTAAVQINISDARVLIMATANAGAACDAGVRAYCDILGDREKTMAKLQAAVVTLEAPSPAPK